MVSHSVRKDRTERGADRLRLVSSDKPRARAATVRKAPSVRSNRIFLYILYTLLILGILFFLAFMYAVFGEAWL